MELTQIQYDVVSDCFPRHRRASRYTNLQILNAFLFVVENGCKRRALPEKYGYWHTVYTRVIRWAHSGVLDRVFAKLQQKQIVSIKIDVISMDSTSIKVHPDAAGTLKKTEHNASARLGEAKTPKFIWLPQAIE
jgi:transposase